MEGDYVGFFDYLGYGHGIYAESVGFFLCNERVITDEFHPERGHPFRDFRPYSSEPHHSKGLAVKLDAGEFVALPFFCL